MESVNKKIKNAQKHVYEGMEFNSGLEMTTYKLLTEAGFSPQHEPRTFNVWQGKKFSVPCYDMHTDRKLKRAVWGINTYKPYDLKYTPDFIFYITDSSGIERMVVVESKGYPSEKYAYQKKLFRSWLEDNAPNSMFFEVHNQKQVKAAIEIINSIKQ